LRLKEEKDIINFINFPDVHRQARETCPADGFACPELGAPHRIRGTDRSAVVAGEQKFVLGKHSCKTECKFKPKIRHIAPGCSTAFWNVENENCLLTRVGVFDTYQEAPKKKYWTSTLFFGLGALDPPPPNTHHPVPPPRQKGYHSAPFGILHPSAYSSKPETIMLQSYGTKTEIRTPMHT